MTDREDDEARAMVDGRPFVRRLVNHPESDSLFEIYTEIEFQTCLENGCDDVTDIEEFEREFRKLQDEKRKDDEKMPKIRTH